MDQNQIIYSGKEFAQYFVYCCDGEQYVYMIDQFRWAKTRLTLIEAIAALLQYGKTIDYRDAVTITTQKWEQLTEFIRNGDINAVRQLHTAMIRYVSAYELEKIRKTEKYLTELLIHFDQGDSS